MTASRTAIALALLTFGAAAGAVVQPTGDAMVQAASPQGAKPEAVETATCQTCHEGVFSKAFTKSRHAGLEAACASCHRGAAEHANAMQSGKDALIPSVKKLTSREINDTCLGCHEKGAQATWKGGVHDRRNLNCTSCHAVHEYKSERHQLKTASEPDTCYTCHPAMRAKSLRTSHHPVREGLMTCGSCHNPHDSTTPKMVSASWVNEKCLECHTEKRGPFFWEHAPVRENCLNCHDPHGSNHDKMLVSQQPWLCQRCHLNTRHPGTLYSNLNSAGELLTASNRATEHACKNCHQSVHGGNAPTAPYLGR
jgi:DmsE family decaheme c-type cytochrome